MCFKQGDYDFLEEFRGQHTYLPFVLGFLIFPAPFRHQFNVDVEITC